MAQGPLWLSLLAAAIILIIVVRGGRRHFRRPVRQLLAFAAGWLAIVLVLALAYQYWGG